MGNIFEALSGWNGGTVYYWDGKVCNGCRTSGISISIMHFLLQESHLLLSGMAGPNGIAYDAKRNKLFVVELKKKVIHVYDLAEVWNVCEKSPLVRWSLHVEKFRIRMNINQMNPIWRAHARWKDNKVNALGQRVCAKEMRGERMHWFHRPWYLNNFL